MSLFFLILTMVTFAISHWVASKSTPGSKPICQKDFLFRGTAKEFAEKLQLWVEQTPSLSFTHKGKGKFIIEREARWMSYGSFYHIDIKALEKDSLYQVYFQLEAKLVSSAKHPFLDEKLLQLLGLEQEAEDKAA